MRQQQQQKKIKEEIKNMWRQVKMKTHDPKSLGWRKSYSKREVYGNTSLTQETRTISKHLNLNVKKLEEEEQSPKPVEEEIKIKVK